MNLLDALEEVIRFLEEEGIEYAVIGGLAVQHWGEPRATRDIDITVMVPLEKEKAFLEKTVERFRPRLADAVAFARERRVLLMATRGGVPVELSLGIPGYEEEVMRRAVTVELPGARPFRVIGVEDLIVHKCVAGRARDVEDIERVLIRQRLRVDLAYIRRWLERFGPLVETHDVLSIFEGALDRARTALESEGDHD